MSEGRPIVAPAVQELREAMDRVRQFQGSTEMAVDLARYDSDTDEINREFLTGFLHILPVFPLYINADSGYHLNFRKDATDIAVKDPVDLRPSSSFGVSTLGKSGITRHTALIIGERNIDTEKVELSEILTVGWHRDISDEDEWLPYEPRVTTFTVMSGLWKQLRDGAINKLHRPFSQEVFMDKFRSDIGAFAIGSGADGVIKASAANFYGSIPSWRLLRKELKRNFSTDSNIIKYHDLEERSLRSSDFDEFEVMTHMEYIAAAFGVGDKFDEVKHAREEKMPEHPAETTFGLKNYRQMVEQPGILDIPSA